MERLGRFSPFGAVALILFSISSIPLFAQNEADSCATALNRPSDVSLRLSLKGGQSIFRQGEIITLIAEYSSTAEKKYLVETRNYDRSGRLSGMEDFCISPDTGGDPLADYFNSSLGFIGGGLGGANDLREPRTITLELNEWKSLRPGSYRLSVMSHRVSAPTDGNPNGANSHPVVLRSNEVQFQVIEADPAWQAEQLSAALQVLDSSDTGDDAKHAARVLRFLGSEASTRELARRYWSGSDQPFGWELKFGLFGSPYRSAAIEGMRAALRSPQHPVTEEAAQTLATLEMQSNPKLRLPVYDEQHQEEWQHAQEAYSAEFEKRIAKYLSQAAAGIQSKAGKARAVTVSELLQSNLELEPAAKAQLRQMLVSSWASLPGRRQNELIQYQWEHVGGPEWLPTLRAIVNGEPERQFSFDRPHRGIALRRIYEIAPNQGRDLILKEIANPKGDVGMDALGILPDRELPQIEQPILMKLKDGKGTDVEYQLLERYASVRAFPEIKSHYEARRGVCACVPQWAMLLYFLRVQPQFGVTQVKDALGRREKTACYTGVFDGLGEKAADPKIERIALEALSDPSLQVDQDAAEALGKYGPPSAEGALWSRLEKFHNEWKEKAEDLQVQWHTKPEMQEAVRLEQLLVEAISRGQGWFVTEETIHRLKSLTGPEMQDEVEAASQEIERGEYELSVSWWPEGRFTYHVGQYQGKGIGWLKQKLAQFPAGTRLSMDMTKAKMEHHKAEFEEIQQTAEGAGLVLQVQTSR